MNQGIDILIVSPHREALRGLLQLLEMVFRENGLSSETIVISASKAIDKIIEYQPPVLLIPSLRWDKKCGYNDDLREGVKFVKEIKNKFPELYVVLLTGAELTDPETHSLSMSKIIIFEKPFDLNKFISLMQTLIN